MKIDSTSKAKKLQAEDQKFSETLNERRTRSAAAILFPISFFSILGGLGLLLSNGLYHNTNECVQANERSDTACLGWVGVMAFFIVVVGCASFLLAGLSILIVKCLEHRQQDHPYLVQDLATK